MTIIKCLSIEEVLSIIVNDDYWEYDRALTRIMFHHLARSGMEVLCQYSLCQDLLLCSASQQSGSCDKDK